jgi:hypothetical protein
VRWQKGVQFSVSMPENLRAGRMGDVLFADGEPRLGVDRLLSLGSPAFAVTHIASGCRITQLRTEADARRLCEDLCAEVRAHQVAGAWSQHPEVVAHALAPLMAHLFLGVRGAYWFRGAWHQPIRSAAV